MTFVSETAGAPTVWFTTKALRRWAVSAAHPGRPSAPLSVTRAAPTGWRQRLRDQAHPRGEWAPTQAPPGYIPHTRRPRLVGNLRGAARCGITTIAGPQNRLGDVALFSRVEAYAASRGFAAFTR